VKAMVFAAGYGERLRPMTERLPKALVPVGGRPMIEYSLLLLRHYGITEIIINVHYLGAKIREHLLDGKKLGLKITYSEEKELLDTGGGLLQARPFWHSNPRPAARSPGRPLWRDRDLGRSKDPEVPRSQSAAERIGRKLYQIHVHRSPAPGAKDLRLYGGRVAVRSCQIQHHQSHLSENANSGGKALWLSLSCILARSGDSGKNPRSRKKTSRRKGKAALSVFVNLLPACHRPFNPKEISQTSCWQRKPQSPETPGG